VNGLARGCLTSYHVDKGERGRQRGHFHRSANGHNNKGWNLPKSMKALLIK